MKFDKLVEEILSEGYYGPSRTGAQPNFRSFDSFKSRERNAGVEEHQGPWYLKINGKTYTQKGEPKAFDSKQGAIAYGNAIKKNNPEAKVMLHKTP